MAEGDATDLFMKFVFKGKAIVAESTTDITTFGDTSNQLLAGFKAKAMFEIDSFTFNAGLNGDDPAATATASAKTTVQHGSAARPSASARPSAQATTATPGGFQAWRAGKATAPYPVDLQPVTFTRSIDKSSTILIQNCIDCIPFDSATLIKRKAAGGSAAGEVFLRLDFYGVLVTAVDWSNDTEVQEKCTFVCRSVGVSYCPQLPSGALGAPISTFWSMVNGTPQPPYA